MTSDLPISKGRPSECNRCGTCIKRKKAEYQRQWARKNKDKIKYYTTDEAKRRASRKTTTSRYGITVEQYDAMYAAQRGLCAICSQPETVLGNNGRIKLLSIDHNHDTGEVRALLCNNCNRAIGLFGDDPDVIESAAAYLRTY